jgi:hypothetical protein
MPRRLIGMLLGFGLSSLAVAGDDKIAWEKADGVLAKSAASGNKPIIWYFINNEFNKNDAGATPALLGGAEPAINNPVIAKHREPFLWVRGDQTLANKFKVQGAPAVIITDADGDVIHRASIPTPEALHDAMQAVLKEKFVDAPVTWGDVVHTGPIKKKLLIVGFDDEKSEGLKALEDRTIVKYHKNCEFVQLPWEKGGEAAKHWSVTQAPAIVICDAQENVLARINGKKSPCEVKAAIVKALQKLEKPHH